MQNSSYANTTFSFSMYAKFVDLCIWLFDYNKVVTVTLHDTPRQFPTI